MDVTWMPSGLVSRWARLSPLTLSLPLSFSLPHAPTPARVPNAPATSIPSRLCFFSPALSPTTLLNKGRRGAVEMDHQPAYFGHTAWTEHRPNVPSASLKPSLQRHQHPTRAVSSGLSRPRNIVTPPMPNLKGTHC
ncbi:hypothetical protein IWX49DRAFT_413095 [Phyllosticta citricarpa]|uniref:Secreted protein n=1 Tax=Phyllosticta citricarpa TaxID=55181 RepID=A0ABR1M727_9PEZI